MRLTNAKTSTGALALLTAGVLAGGLFASGGAASAAGTPGLPKPGHLPNARSLTSSGTKTTTRFLQLNNSGVQGTATVTVSGRKLDVTVNARGLLRNMPHAMHIHFSPNTRHSCPTVRDDKNADHRLTTSEGDPAYGDVRVSLTKSGATGPSSALAVNRFPTAPRGRIHYHRTVTTTLAVARAVKNGKAALVIHGVDYNQNGKYDFAAGKSDLDPMLPAEATDPVACGILRQPKSALPLP